VNWFEVKWQVTAKTILCDVTGEVCTILVYKDGRSKCTVGEKRRFHCPRVQGYKEALFAEEKRSG